MGILYDRLLILLNESSSDSTFYHIALAMLQNMELLHSLAINEVADLCRVSKSTISKRRFRFNFFDVSDGFSILF